MSPFVTSSMMTPTLLAPYPCRTLFCFSSLYCRRYFSQMDWMLASRVRTRLLPSVASIVVRCRVDWPERYPYSLPGVPFKVSL